ncbi:Glutathione S-transferase-like protein ustS [Paramyrothecium foliicola]|nr:Glutathione S-transferase-like protein ustS [Paramyrothecium foliicola]
MSGKAVLYDLPSKGPRITWTLNAWKGRLVLNFKGTDYRMEWVEYGDMEPTFAPHVEANTEGWPYTIPTVQFPDGKWVMDSRKIAEELERRQPEPSLRLESPKVSKVDELANQVLGALLPNAVHRVPTQVLNDASVEHWIKTRTAALGVTSLADFEREKGGLQAFKAAEPALHQLTALLKENTDGPFFDGKEAGFADFIWVGFLVFLKRLGDDAYEGVVNHTGDRAVHEKLLEASAPWLERNAE